MNPEKRYGAYLILIFIFLAIFSLNSSKVFSYSNQAIPQNTNEFNHTNANPVGEPANPALKAASSPFPGFPININTASKEELMILPGIGEKTAVRILEKRAEIGSFTSVDQLTDVKWIGKVKVEKLRGLVTAGKASSVKGK
ncbi:MAG: helix-hairpin-helix domain-containing protein [Deltaproteobacteria bacterium]|nr:helix-hairpin-helix domain-containing protein [Deltaproteobacteria bacterium]